MTQPHRFDTFTERARLSLSFAQEEAQHFKQDSIDTEHLLLGLIDIGNGAALQLLQQLGIDPQAVREAVVDRIGRDFAILRGEIGLTPRAKKVIELAVVESRLLFHGNIGTEHLLLGLIGVNEGIAAEVLAHMGVTRERARLAAGELVGYPHGEPRAGAAATPVLDHSATGPSDASQKTPEQMRATAQQMLNSQTPAQIRQIIQTVRQHIDMLEQMLKKQEASNEKADEEERGDV